MSRGRIIKLISNQYEVLLDDKTITKAIASGKMRIIQTPRAGDFVEIEMREEKAVIVNIEKRINDLNRPPIANIDQMLIVMSAVDPDFSVNLVDQMLIMANFHHIDVVLVVTKMDLIDAGHYVHDDINDYEKSGYKVVRSGKHYDTSEIEELVANKFTVLSGQSGAGKSSLLNRINPNFDLRIQETSKALGRGKHTTRHVEFLPVAKGWVADTPGFSKIDLTQLSKEELRDSMLEFQEPAQDCRFRDCYHINEPGCAIRSGVEAGTIVLKRYENYVKFYQDIDDTRKRY